MAYEVEYLEGNNFFTCQDIEDAKAYY